MTINTIVVEGNLTKDPLYYEPNEDKKAFSLFRVAINTYRQRTKEPVFINVKSYGRLAEQCGEYLTKGQKVFVSGELANDVYKGGGKDGEDLNTIAIVANSVTFGPSKRNNNEDVEEDKEDLVDVGF